MSDKIIAYKGMDENMCCRGKQYEIGKTYTEDKAICCISGMHACENPLDVFQYYRPDGKNRFFEVECNGAINKGENDSKLACTELKVTGELSLAKFIRLSVQTTFELAMNRAKKKTSGSYSSAATSGDRSSAATSGSSSSAATSGDYSSAATSGDRSSAATSGSSSSAATSGSSSSAATSGSSSSAATSGSSSSAATSGDSSSAATSGSSSSAATSGDYSSAATSGDRSSAATSGDYSSAATSGSSSSATATGFYCRAQAEGKNSLSMANGAHSKARGVLGCYLVLTEYDDGGKLLWAKIAKVDGTAIKENVWYTLKNGEFEEA